MLKRVLAVLFLFALSVVVTSRAEAGITVAIDIGDDGDFEFTSPAFLAGLDPSPSNFTVPFVGVTEDDFVDGIRLNGTVDTFESEGGSMINEIHLEVGGATTVHTMLRVNVTWTAVDAPTGSPLSLLSSVSTAFGLDPITPSTYTSFLNGLPGGGLTASITGPVNDSDAAVAVIDPVVHPMTISSSLKLNFPAGNAAFNANATTTVSPIPEAGTLIAWGLAAALVGIVGFVRKRRTA